MRIAIHRFVIFLAALAAAPAVLAGQSPEDRRELERYRDSLASVSDSASLLSLESRLIALAKGDRDNAMRHLRLGLVAFRLGELGSHSRFDDAAGEFAWATDLQPDWPWAWYGLGLAEDRVGDSEVALVSGLQAMFGKDHLSRAANAYVRSVQADPSFVLGLVELASTALRQRINVKTDLARAALREAAATTASRNPDVLLYRGRVEREVGDIDSALVAFREYLNRGGHRGLGLLELARTQLLDGQPAGYQTYLEGAALDDSLSVAGYRADLALIARDSALAEFDFNKGERRVAFLRRFWGQRDRSALLLDGERLCEHYRRIHYAHQHFQLVSQNRHFDIVERYRSGSNEFDDRGIIYIRHGEPTRRATLIIQGTIGNDPRLNETWEYDRTEGPLVFHFLAREDLQDYKLVESLFDILGFDAAISLQRNWNGSIYAGTANDLVYSRDAISPIYGRLLSSGGSGAQRYMNEERLMGRRSIERGTTTDTYEFSYAQDLGARTGLMAVGGPDQRSTLHVTYAIPGSTLRPVHSERGLLYPIRLRLSALDRTGRPVVTIDTTRVFFARAAVPKDQYLVGALQVPVVPGWIRYRVGLEQGPDNGVMLPPDTMVVGDFSGRHLEISDLILGARSAHLTWRPDDADTVWFNPTQQFSRKETMELYNEIHGILPQSTYKTEVRVFKEGSGKLLGIFGSKKPAIRLAFDDVASGETTPVRRGIALDRLSPGRYWIEVAIKDEVGSSRASRSAFDVTD